MLRFGNIAQLQLVVRSNQTTQRTIFIRGITRSGTIGITHVGTSTTTLTESIHGIDDIPILLSVAPVALANVHGDLFVSVSLRINGDLSIPLLSGFVTQAKGLSWPNTNLQDLQPGHGHDNSIQITQPAAGAEFTITVPANRLWRIHSVTFTLVTDANPASRLVRLILTHLGTSFIIFPASTTQAASLSRFHSFLIGASGIPAAVSTTIISTFPDQIWAAGEDVFESDTVSRQVGDQFSVIALNVEEFFEGA